MSAEETEDERNDRLNREIWRRMQQTSEEWKVEELMKLYQPDYDGWDLFDAQIAGRAREELQEILKAKWTREEPRGCPNKRCNGTERRPCRLLQYIESCTTCGRRIGDVPFNRATEHPTKWMRP